MEDLTRILEQAWAEELEPVCRVVSEELREQEEKREKKLLFLGKKEVVSNRSVVYRNGEFFIEANGSSFVIRPRWEKEYLRIRGKRNKKYTKFTRAPCSIVIPMPVVRENPMLWFEQNYLSNVKRNQQGAFIKKIWEHRYEFMPVMMMG